MRVRVVLMLLLTQMLATSVCLSAQDKRTVTEPKFPPTCAVYAAALQSTPLDGPVIGNTVEEQNAESSAGNGYSPGQVEDVQAWWGG